MFGVFFIHDQAHGAAAGVGPELEELPSRRPGPLLNQREGLSQALPDVCFDGPRTSAGTL